jgi:two-component system phosphate regulon sensor histidine kinase PhoR
MTVIRQTEIMRRDFVANVSHELRTPLSAIEGYAETLLEGALEDEVVRLDFVKVIHRHSIRLTHLVSDLLDLSKLESPDYTPTRTPVYLSSLIEEQIYDLVSQKALDKQITFSVELSDNLPPVLADVSSLQQVFTNLLDNAIKYTPQNGKVILKAYPVESSRVQVDVIDNGIGIESKYFSRLFERFYRVDKARSRDLGGTGLGLSIVKHIVQVHGGDIWVSSALNKGSKFSFTLQQAIL